MENATKALLIAGAVLIAIILIALGLGIVGSTEGVVNEVKSTSTTMEVAMFNSQFTQYEGVRRGTEVNELIRKINLNNTRNTNRQISGTTGLTIDVTKVYVVSFSTTNTDGYVNSVTINEKT